MAFAISTAAAAPIPYRLDTERSKVGFHVRFGPDKITGEIPVQSADIQIDFQNPANNRVEVILDSTRAQASFPFATQAMRGPKVLDADQFPTMIFRSTGVRLRSRESAEVAGMLTLRGQTHPVTLRAQLFRQRGTEPGDLSRLLLRVTGRIKRSTWGATGWMDMVSDEIDLDMIIRIERAP
ncbi:YceI family protein [Jhaorihella thermophila]